jgi:hypothetical protein
MSNEQTVVDTALKVFHGWELTVEKAEIGVAAAEKLLLAADKTKDPDLIAEAVDGVVVAKASLAESVTSLQLVAEILEGARQALHLSQRS